MASGPPKFKPFTKTKVILSLEPTPTPVQQATELLAAVPAAFPRAENAALGDGAPEMFAKKKREPKEREPGAPRPKGPGAKARAATLFPGLIAKARTILGAPGGPGANAGQVYARMNVMSRDTQAAEIAKFPEAIQKMAKEIVDVEVKIPYQVEPAPPVFIPTSRRGFGSFLIDQYGPIFPTGSQRALDVATCAAKGDAGKKEVKIYHYQAFVREYLRYETPYRGLLVYHGLGSGKTCSAIAAAEALFGTRGMKIVVMTPFSLRDNFISEITFCGFKHFRLQNHWVPIPLKGGAGENVPDATFLRMFAKSVYGIPDTFFKKGRGKEITRFWIPDFTKEEEPNFDSLSAQERSEIQSQIRAIIETRVKFINYNGITARELKTMVCSTPDIFDNAVIVVDEIHNLTRLIQGSLEGYFTNPSGRRRVVPLERLTPEREKLPLCGMTKNYLRGYLFYRLFMDAKNSKIIGLSGTPLINFPEELGILMNILHGPLQQMKFEITAEAMRDTQAVVTKAVERNADLDSVFFKAAEGNYIVTVMRLPEQFTKVFGDDNELLGIRRRDPGATAPTLAEIYAALETDLKAEKVTIRGKPALTAQELLPSWDTPFRAAFLEEDGITLKNELVLKKRMRGLISYYRGIQGSVMPRVKKDETVGIPLTGYSLKIYNKLRNQEIQQEMQKPKEGAGGGKDDIWAEANEIATMKSPSNYRMSSRQACNFVFPESITRPRPRDLGEFDVETGRDRDQVVDADVEDAAAGHEVAEGEEVAEAEDAAARAEMAAPAGPEAVAAGEAAKVGFGVGAKERMKAYLAAIKASKERLRAIGETHLKLDGPPEHNLAKYSPKFAAMLTNMNKLSGSSLVYSQFLEMEGIGIFGICLEANGWAPIEILETADGMKFSDRTIASLAKGPGVKQSRYIEFTGVGSKEQRGAAVNVFNARIDKLSPAMAKVLTDAGWENNFDGGLCRAFMITSAGAEGLSLKCVRGVHVMEPYWNTVRTEQVKGRAVRICSHMDLPEDQQDVEIYTYCTMIPDEAIAAQAVDRTLEQSDSYNAKAAADLGVPIPGVSEGPVPEGLFLPVVLGGDGVAGAEGEEEGEAAVGAQATMMGAVRFYSKLANEYRGFSNFAPTPFVLNEKRYPTAEHYFQSMKFPDDTMYAEAIRVAPTPAKAKFLGQTKDHKARADWDKVKESVMLEGLRAKFRQNKGILELLKATGTRPIIEASPDPYWGEGRTGKGKNRLGKLLEQVREELREFAPPAPEEAGDGAAAAAPLAVEGEGVIDDEFFGGENVVEEEGAAAAGGVGGEGEEEGEEKGAPEGGEGEVGPAEAGGAGGERLLKGGGKEDERQILLTSDQRVLLISLRKKVVLSALATAMKSVAVDCELNFADNNDGTFRCLDLGESVGDFAYHPDLAEDIAETEARFRKAKPIGAKAGAAATAAAALAPAELEAALAPPKPAEAEAAVAAVAGGEGEAPPPLPVAAPPPPPPAAPAVKKPKRLMYKGTEYYYQIKMGGAGKPEGYMLFAITDPELNTPIGFIKANEKGMPSGPVLPPA